MADSAEAIRPTDEIAPGARTTSCRTLELGSFIASASAGIGGRLPAFPNRTPLWRGRSRCDPASEASPTGFSLVMGAEGCGRRRRRRRGGCGAVRDSEACLPTSAKYSKSKRQNTHNCHSEKSFIMDPHGYGAFPARLTSFPLVSG